MLKVWAIHSNLPQHVGAVQDSYQPLLRGGKPFLNIDNPIKKRSQNRSLKTFFTLLGANQESFR
jgi:hypothetical protein